MAETLAPAEMEGILDRLRNGRELLGWLSSGIIGEITDLIKLVPEGRYGEALVDVGDILGIAGLAVEAEAVRRLGTAMTPRPFDWPAIVPPACRVLEVALLRVVAKRDGVPDGTIRMGAAVMEKRKSIAEMTRAEAQKWLADNAAQVREGKDYRVIRRRLSARAPEVLEALDGKPVTVSLTPERAEQIIKALDWAIAIATIAGMFFPAALAVSTALRAIQVYLKSKYPEVAATVEGFEPDGTDRGLALEDFAVLSA